MTKKMTRVVSAESGDADAAMTSGVVPDAVVPTALPADHLQTRRERLLKKAFAAKRASRASGEKKQTQQKASKKLVVKGDSSSDGPRKAKDVQQQKLVNAATQKAARSEVGTHTSLNLSAARRHDMFVSELNQFNRVVSMPEFQSDPMDCIQQHLATTMRSLKPQTPDVGRAPVDPNRVHSKPKPRAGRNGSK